jgi:hypothetical protein
MTPSGGGRLRRESKTGELCSAYGADMHRISTVAQKTGVDSDSEEPLRSRASMAEKVGEYTLASLK